MPPDEKSSVATSEAGYGAARAALTANHERSGERSSRRLAHLLFGGNGQWPALWMLTLAAGAITSLIGYIDPSVGAQYYNGWNGDPCLGQGSVSAACQTATQKYLHITSVATLAATLVYVLAVPVVGTVADALGRFPMVVLSLCANLAYLTSFTCFFAHKLPIVVPKAMMAVPALLPWTFLWRLLLLDYADESDRMLAFSISYIITDGEGLVLPFVGQALNEKQLVLVSYAMFAILVVPSTLRLWDREKGPAKRKPASAAHAPSLRADISETFAFVSQRGFVRVMLVELGDGLTRGFWLANIQVVLREAFGVSVHGFMRFSLVSNATIFVTQLGMAPWLLQHVGMQKLLLVSYLVGAAGLLTVWSAPTLWVAYLGGVLFNVSSMAQPALNVLRSVVVPEPIRGKAYGAADSITQPILAITHFSMVRLGAYCAEPHFGMDAPMPRLPLALSSAIGLTLSAGVFLGWSPIEELMRGAKRDDDCRSGISSA